MRTCRLGYLRGLASLSAILLLIACGGGGEDDDGPPQNPACDNRVTMDPNSHTAGVLESGDCTMATLLPGSGDNSFVDLYRVTLPSAGTLTVAMNSGSSFDAFLFLVSDDLQTLINLDDDSGGAPNARIQMPIGAGTYVVLANSFAPGESGPYGLTLTFMPDN
jgi:Bacterial pre-peptidase C-terminal domain